MVGRCFYFSLFLHQDFSLIYNWILRIYFRIVHLHDILLASCTGSIRSFSRINIKYISYILNNHSYEFYKMELTNVVVHLVQFDKVRVSIDTNESHCDHSRLFISTGYFNGPRPKFGIRFNRRFKEI